MQKRGISGSMVGASLLGVLVLAASPAPNDVHTAGSLPSAGPTLPAPESAAPTARGLNAVLGLHDAPEPGGLGSPTLAGATGSAGTGSDATGATNTGSATTGSAASASGLAVREQAVQGDMEVASDLYKADSAAAQRAAAAYAQATAERSRAEQDLGDAQRAVIAAKAQVEKANRILAAARRAAGAAVAADRRDEPRAQSQRGTLDDVIFAVYQGIQSNATEDAASDAQHAAANALAQAKAARDRAQQAEIAANALITQQKTALAVATQAKADALASYDQLKKENNRVEAQLAELASIDRTSGTWTSAPIPTTISGYDMMPIHGTLSSRFGMRFDPVYKRWQLHAGVDIAAATGTPIRAARAGTVTRAGWDGGNGNYTCVDTGLYQGAGKYHGKDVVNCYAHQSKILVHPGEQVSLGQVIGKVGMTGAATGPHLHFEVRVDGTPVQPLNWLPACFC